MSPWNKKGQIVGIGFDSQAQRIIFTRNGTFVTAIMNASKKLYSAFVCAGELKSREAENKADVKTPECDDKDAKEAWNHVRSNSEKFPVHKYIDSVSEIRVAANFGPNFLFDLKKYAKDTMVCQNQDRPGFMIILSVASSEFSGNPISTAGK